MRISRFCGVVAFCVGAFTVVGPLACSGTKHADFANTLDAAETGDLFSDSSVEGSIGNGGTQDGDPDQDGRSCSPDASATPGPVQRLCVHYGADDNECDGHHDLTGFPANAAGGNGFDDNCNGLVDEGCSCPTVGATKDCYLVPASQTAGGLPVGWCATNSKGSMDCGKNGEFPKWSGQCRGAQPPYGDDACAPGDFNCDGAEQNSATKDCSCHGEVVTCPVDVLQTVPYPNPSLLPLKVDAATWFLSASLVSSASNWKWTLRGGDCDNIAPHPSFGIYNGVNGNGNPLGTQNDTLGSSGKEHGMVASAPAVNSVIYPAFSLSGDYIVDGEFDWGGKHYACSQKIQVRAPGLRTELCWSNMDSGGNHADVDLHLGLTSGIPPSGPFTCPANRGWSGTCGPLSTPSALTNEDCYYSDCKNDSATTWYPVTASPAGCVGWGSKTTGSSCNNPRLDRDIVSCERSETNPNSTSATFCGSENINVDAPVEGNKFAVGVKYYSGSVTTNVHVNVYCNGERVLSTGYNPVTGNDFPKLATAGFDSSGDMWKAALVTTHVTGGVLTCDVKPTPSNTPYPITDGSKSFCVDNGTSNSVKFFSSGGAAPFDAAALCFH